MNSLNKKLLIGVASLILLLVGLLSALKLSQRRQIIETKAVETPASLSLSPSSGTYSQASIRSFENNWLKVTIYEDTLGFDIIQKNSNKIWRMSDNLSNGISIKTKNGVKQVSFSDAEERTIEPFQESNGEGVRITLKGFHSDTGLLGAALTIKITLENSKPEILVEIETSENEEFQITEVEYPPFFKSEQSEGSYAVIPLDQGFILPAKFKEEVRYELPLLEHTRSWFGAVSGNQGFIEIIETPWDVNILVNHLPGGPTSIGLKWESSLGKMAYPRRLRLSFQDSASYVTIAKSYRRYLQEQGSWKSLTEKAKEVPNVKRLAGMNVVPISICTYEGSPTLQVINTFSEAAEKVRNLYQLGYRNLFIHVDGWGKGGYDNFHPDALPPCPEAGGWEGLHKLSEAAKQANYLFGLHDNYHDFYFDSPAFDEKLTMKDANGNFPVYSWYPGGKQSVLCTRVALPFLQHTLEEMHNHNINLTAYYLDSFSAIMLEECYDPNHPMTRKQAAEYRAQLLDYVRSLGIAVSSEQGADWAISHLDFVYWILGPKFGIPVPLFNLVYHDALVTPVGLDAPVTPVGGYNNISQKYLYSLLYGENMLILSPSGRSKVEAISSLSKIHQYTAFDELVNHRIVSDDYAIQESEFASGVKVWVDFNHSLYQITGVPGVSEEKRCLLNPQYQVEVNASDFQYLGDRKFSNTFKWDVRDQLPKEDFKAFVHLFPFKKGNIAGGYNHDLSRPTSTWQLGEVITDGPYTLELPKDLSPGVYDLFTGLFNDKKGNRVDLINSDPLNKVFLGEVIVEGSEGNISSIRFEPVQREKNICDLCGNGVCDEGENSSYCREDCQTFLAGDANKDGRVDSEDFALLVEDYLKEPEHNTDFNSDGRVDSEDFAILQSNYLKEGDK